MRNLSMESFKDIYKTPNLRDEDVNIEIDLGQGSSMTTCGTLYVAN